MNWVDVTPELHIEIDCQCSDCLADAAERRAGPDPDDLPAEAYDADDARDQVTA